MFALLGASLVLAVFGLATAAASAAIAAVWPVVPWAAGRMSAAARARLLYALRFFPVAVGVIVAGALAANAWLTFEPRHAPESLGAPLAAAAGAALTLLVVAAGRGLRAWRAGHHLARRWTAAGTPVQLDGVTLPAYRIAHSWPVVCVVGTLRPRLFLAESVLESCTPDELASVLAHETGHVGSRDNLKRLLIQFLPDAIAWIPRGRALERAWENASEAAADARAVRARSGSALDLAAALVRVARLAASGAWVELPARALLDGEGVAPRVKRLLEGEANGRATGRVLLAWALILALPAALLLSSHQASVLRAVQEAAEVLVQAR